DFERDALPLLSADEDPLPSRIHGLLRRFSGETLLLARAAAPGTVVAERVALYMARLAGTSTALTGKDLARLGIPEGEAVGEILGALLDARLDGRVWSDDEEEALARSLAETLTHGEGTGSFPDYPTTADQDPEAREMVHEELLEEQAVAEAVDAVVDQASPESGVATSSGTHSEFAQEAPVVHRPVYEVRLDAFEGPLDLLLHLIREHEIDIYDIPIATITQQYLDYINFMESLDLALAGEFLEMAATLIRIKVQMLLPKEIDGTEEEEDPREQLVRKLVEYRQFKEVATTLSGKEEERRKFFPRGVDPKSYVDVEEEIDIEDFLRDVTLFDLVDGLREVLSRVPERIDVHSVDMDEFTVEEQIQRIRGIIAERGSIPFADAFGAGASRIKIIATFIALLELIRLGEVRALQKRNFGDIEIEARVEE
ncbi:MAG: segregation/condensation protein A, partial [Candidatus Eisenbacteria bacterium]